MSPARGRPKASGTAMLAVALGAVVGLCTAHEISAQTGRFAVTSERADSRAGILYRVDSRIGFLITSGQTFGDRPVVQIDGGVQFGAATPGGPPRVGLTGGFTIGAARFLGGTDTSIRFLAGAEFPWALSRSIELAPAVQAGYLKAFDEDERHGFTSRVAVGIRVLPSRGAFYFGFEPIALVTLPLPDATAEGDPGSRVAAEFGLLRFGWRF